MDDQSDLMDIKIIHIFVVFISSLAGVTAPLYLSHKVGMDVIFLLRSFATGVILALAFCHMLPDSAELTTLTNYNGLNGALMLLGVVMNLCAERLSIDLAQANIVCRTFKQVQPKDEPLIMESEMTEIDAKQAESRNIESVDRMFTEQPQVDILQNKPITAEVIELGLIVHTIIIGISVGTWKESRGSLIIFTAAMGFHQLFEGIGLGTIVADPSNKIKRTKQAIMICAFTLSFPFSICIGIYLSYTSSDPQQYALVSGVSQCIACGLLMYIGLVSFVAEDYFGSRYVNQPAQLALRWKMLLSLLFGAAIMALVGVWA